MFVENKIVTAKFPPRLETGIGTLKIFNLGEQFPCVRWYLLYVSS